jgi:flagellar biosynthetic protein FliQ
MKMSEVFVVGLGREALFTALLVAAPMLGLALVIGLAVSIFQATTQIQEQTLSFIPKLIAIFGGLALFGPWMLTTLLEFTRHLFENLTRFIG